MNPGTPAIHSRPRDVSALADALRRGSRRLTGPRLAILKALQQSSRPLTHKEVHRMLGEGECDLATVYRTLSALESLALASRCDFGDGAARFELAGADRRCHHHHLVCRNCEQVVELAECVLRDLESALARQHGFAAVTHRLEFFGLCPRCQGQTETPDAP